MKMLKRMLKSEAGQVLPMALVLLALGGFLVVPIISLMTTNLNATRQIDQANLELYAADAGVENVLWSIGNDPGVLPALHQTKTINLPAGENTINGMNSVTTTIYNYGNRMYRINSIATRPGGHNTEVEAFVNCLNYSNLLEGAITSNDDVTIRNTTITGKIFYADQTSITGSDLSDQPEKKTQTNWPTWDDLSPMYLNDVQGHTYTGKNPLYIDSLPIPRELGPIYYDGSLTIDNNTAGLTLKLTGTLYVTGNLIFGQAKNYTIDLNNQTMFVHGTGTGYAISMPSNTVQIIGSGCIIANGDIEFKPGMDAASPSDYVLVMSLAGQTYMQPGGTFYGSLVGKAEVEVQNGTLTYTDPYSHDLNFPGLTIGGEVPFSGEGKIVSYTIK